MLPENLWKEAELLRETIGKDRRYLHLHPGTGFEIQDTVSYVNQELIQMGYEPTLCGKAGIVAVAGGKREGKVFLLRADMDALPIREEAEVDFAAENGKMHACGHDMHTAMLLGAARLLKQHEDEIEGSVKLMFQPAEEILEGAYDMIQAGVLQNPAVDAALMIHVMAGMPFPVGTIVVSGAGVSAPAADYFEIHVKGKGCHGAMPDTGIDPLNAAAHILIALQEIAARELAMNDRAVMTIGTMHAGTASNVIPDCVTMKGSMRAFEEKTRIFMKQRIIEIAKGIAESFRAEAEVRFGSGCPTLVNDKELAESVLKYVKELLGTQKAFSVTELNAAAGGQQSYKASGSEDFAYVSHEVPSIMMALAAGQPEKGYVYPQHHPMVRFDEEALTAGCAVYAYTAMRWLEEQG